MKQIAFYLLLALTLFSSLNSQSQKILKGIDAEMLVSGSEQVIINEKNNSLSFVVMKSGSFIEENSHLNWLSSTVLKQNSDYQFVLYKKEKDNLGFTHYRYKQYYKGIKVEHGVYYVHAKDGKVTSANGEFYSNINKSLSSVFPEVNLNTALNKAKSLFNSSKITDHTKSNDLIILSRSNASFLCYRFELSTNNPLKHSDVYVDAQTNKIILEINKIHTADVPGTLTTNYSGTKSVTIDQVGSSQYRLQQSAKNIYTKNCNNSSSIGWETDFTNSSATWSATTPVNKSVFDLYYGLEKSYDYYNSKFSRVSYDGFGSQIQGIAHYDYEFNNAFWDGTYMVFGDGDGSSYNPFSCTDIVGHELTHAVTESSAGLVYMDESGGLNESFSDIFGVAIDFYANPTTANFLEGEQCSVTNTPFRNMISPKTTYQPDTYMGQYWEYDGGIDNGGVHTNSQVQNHWFYLLCQGGTGINDNSVAYNISAIGISNAEKIAYRNLTNYLTPNSTYDDARIYAIQSAIDLFGACSNNVTQCANAWYAVGVGSSLYTNAVVSQFSSNNNYSCSVPAVISFFNNSLNSSSYTWHFGDGGTSTSANPSHTYTSTGNFNVKLISIGTSSCNTTDSITKTNFVTVTNVGMPTSACTPSQGNSSSSYGITKVEFGSISKTSADASEGYKSFVCSNQASLVAGNPYLLKITTPGSYEKVSVWIDYNNDGILNQTNELILNSTNTLGTIYTHTLVVQTPTNVTLNTPLRLRVTDDYTTISGSCATHYYGQTEDYTVRFNASTVKPVTNFYSNKNSTTANTTINFYDSTLNAPTNYRWEFQGGSPSTSVAKNPSVLYPAIGTYSVKLVATNSFGADSITKIAYIKVLSVFNLCAGTNSTSTTSGTLYDSGGPSSGYYNNENCQFLINPGCTGTITASFTQFSLESCCDYLRIYNGTTTAAPLLGSFNGSTIPPTLYATSGKMLFVWTTDGSATYPGFTANWTSVISGTVPPVANFSVNPNPPLGSPVLFTDQTTNVPVQWYWQFGDGTTSSLQNPSKTYTVSGVKTITLSATNCNTTSIVTKTILVQGPPTISVTPNPVNATASCGGTVAVTATVSNTGSGDLLYNINNQSTSNAIKVLYISGYSGSNETTNMNTILSSISNCTVTNHSLTNITNFQNALVGKNVLLIPEVQNMSTGIISTYSNSIINFANSGGLVVTCGNMVNITNEIGLFNASYVSTTTSGSMVVLDTTDLITKTIPLSINAQNATFYATFTGTNTITDLVEYSGYSVVSKKNIGSGKAVYIGYDYYLMDAYASKILSNALKSGVSSTSWLSVSPNSGTVTASGSNTISLVFNTTNLAAGVYTTNVVIASNDIATPSYSLPVSYTVSGAASASVSANCLGFGSIMQYASKTDSITLFNTGCATLSVTSLSTVNAAFTYTPSGSFTIAPWSNKKVYVKFNPSSTGVYSDTLKIFNNGGNKNICLTGTVTPPPIITVNPSSLTATLSACNSTQTVALNIGNVGGSNLTYSLSGATATGSVNILVIMNNVNTATNYANILSALNSYSTNYTITQHTLTTASNLQNALVGKHVLLFPQPSSGYSTGQYQTYSTTIGTFANNGGTVIMSGNYSSDQINDIGLFNSTYNYYTSSGYSLNVLDTNDVIMKYVPLGFITSANYTYYNSISNSSASHFVKYNSYAVVSKINVGLGRAILLGYDFYNSNTYASRILSNSVKSSGNINPQWLTNSVTTGTIIPSSTSLVTYTFNSGNLAAGTYTSNVIVKSNDPLTPTYTVPVTMIINDNPCAGFVFTNPNNCSGIVTFTNNTVNTVTSYNWNFGNGTTSTATSPTVTYVAAGTYSVILTACNGTMCSSYSRTLTVNGVGGPLSNSCTPTSYLYGSNYGILNVTLNTINKSSNYSNPEGYQDFSCGNQTTLTLGTTYALSVTTNSFYNENVSAWIDFDNNGIFSSTEQILTSYNKLMTHTVNVSLPTNAVLNTPLRMRVIDDSYNYTISSPCYNSYYGQAEDYTVKIQPNNVPPLPAFSAQVNSCQGTVNFTDNSLNNPTSWMWNFGDGNASSLQNPSHTFTSSGTYTVLLIASNSFGSNYTSQVVTVNPLTFNIGVNGTMAVSQPLTYTTSLNGGLAYTWDFGDGSLSGSQNASHSYTAAGTYTVKLTIISGGCVNSVTTTVVILGSVGLIESASEPFTLIVYPNPFNNQTSINIKVNEPVVLSVEILNSLGQIIKPVADKKMFEKGNYEFPIDNLAKGIYFIKFINNEKINTLKLISLE
ncbi:MAG: PKD domain-containing protein [Bacteroidota bacterium]